MNTILMESLYELNDIIAECNSSIIYESIILESDEDNVIDVEYRNTDEKYKKKNKIVEKVKSTWKTFVAMMKKMMKTCIEFIKKNARMIKETFSVKVYVVDRSSLLDGLRQLNIDTKSGVMFKKIVDKKNNDDPYTEKYYNDDNKVVRLPKADAIKLLEKQLAEANKLIDDFDKQVDALLIHYDENKQYMDLNSTFDNKIKVELVNFARNSYKKLINNIATDLQDLTTKKRDMKG